MGDRTLPKLLTRRELAELFGVTENALAVQHSSGALDLPFYKRGTRVYYSVSDVLAFLERHRVMPSADPAARPGAEAGQPAMAPGGAS